MKQVVILEVEFDPTESDTPGSWDWTDLVGDPVRVLYVLDSGE